MKILLALLIAAPLHAEDWTDYEPPAAPPTAEQPTSPEGGFSRPERDKLDGWLHTKVLDKVCQGLKPKLGKDFAPGDAGLSVGGEAARYMVTRPDGGLSLVDEERLRASFGKALPVEQANLWLSASITGASVVVRPLKSKEPCREIDETAKLWHAKTVLPFKGERISEMEIGELWRIPFTLSYTQAPSLSDALAERTTLSVSFSRTHAGSASMTVYRLAPNQTRFRFRIDRVVVKSAGAGVNVTVPAVEFAMNAHNILLKYAEKEVAKQLSSRVSAWMSYAVSHNEGNRVVLEFVVDPRDPEQAAALADALKGDIDELFKAARRITTLRATKESTLATYHRLRLEHSEALGPARYSAINEYSAKSESFSANLPFLVQKNVSSLFGQDKITPQDGGDTEYRFYRAGDANSAAYFDVPFIGPWVKEGSYHGAETVTHGEPGKPHGEPILVYSANHDYLRVPSSSFKGSIREMNDVLSLAGARRGSARLITIPEKVVPSPLPGREGKPDEMIPEWSDRKGALSLTMVLNAQATKDAVSAAGDDILQSMAAAVDPYSKPLADWLAANGKVVDGKVVYDESVARRDWGRNPGGENDMTGALVTLSRQTTKLLADFAWVRASDSNEERARRTAKVIAGQGSSRLPYQQVLKVMVQYVDPLDMTGDFVANIQGTDKKVPGSSAHLVLKKDRKEVPMLSDAGLTKQRFAEPSLLTD